LKLGYGIYQIQIIADGCPPVFANLRVDNEPEDSILLKKPASLLLRWFFNSLFKFLKTKFAVKNEFQKSFFRCFNFN
jgi:hypothetical protein